MKYILLFIIPFFTTAQQTETVDFTRITATITPDAISKKVTGNVEVTFLIKKNTDKVYLDAINTAHPSREFVNDAVVELYYTEDKIWFHSNFEKGYEYTVAFDYVAYPKQTLYFTGDQIWTQGQGKYTSHWLPSIDDMNDKIEFDLKIKTTNDKTVIANGKLKEIINQASIITQLKKLNPIIANDSTLVNKLSKPTNESLWVFDMEQPMSSYLVAFVLGDFQRGQEFSENGTKLYTFIKPEDSLKAEPTYRYTKQIFDFMEAEIGVLYPWQDYKQVPVRDFLYAGMENTSCTIFSEAFVVDEIGFNDRNFVNVNAHELAHQWFGNLVTETSGEHHWLHEGFATFYALFAERELFGDEYYYWKLFQSAESLQALSNEGKGQSLLNPKASSLTFYEKGAWALHILRERIGDDAFKMAVHQYLETHKFKNVTTADFLEAVRANTLINIDAWEQDWLLQTAFKSEQAYSSLKSSTFMNDYFEVAALRASALKDKYRVLERVLTFPNDYIGQEAVYQLALEPIETTIPLYKKAFESNNILVRQAIAVSFEGAVPQSLQANFESLLKDESYVTREAALLLLRNAFPQKINAYLEITRGEIGFQDKNLRQIWLVLALLKEGYETTNKEKFKKELNEYTSQAFGFQVREKAFEYVAYLDIWNENSIKSLVNACTHHFWRFRDSSRAILEAVIKNGNYSKIIKKGYLQFSASEKEYLTRIKFEI
ncbi:M1 family metallopeptidase [Patiriisocius sp. Uisw_017]|jgi:aminopeptidase N|uniref:M1 family metallopeptidase n=1 Tax=Patiriisocius sp. Uisw_017 TaxID=3230968 RepID=UPI0039E8AA53